MPYFTQYMNFNSHHTRKGNAWKFVKTLRVKFFPFGCREPPRMVTVNDYDFYKGFQKRQIDIWGRTVCLVMLRTYFIDKCMTAMAMVMRGNSESMVRKQFDWLIFSNMSTNKNKAWVNRYSTHTCLQISQWTISFWNNVCLYFETL